MKQLTRRLFLAIILGICSAFLLACGATQTKEALSSPSAKAAAPTTTSSKKALVVYFSRSGKTQTVAQQIVDKLHANSVLIEASEPYSEVYHETTQRARRELDTNAYPEIKPVNTKVSDYNVIFVGYPIWGGRAPRPVMTFLASQDFAGKTVVTFCTSGGSPISGSTPEIKAQIPNANVIEGIRAYPDNENATLKWLNSLEVLK